MRSVDEENWQWKLGSNAILTYTRELSLAIGVDG